MPRRFDIGALLAGVGAVLLFVSLFLDWYDVGSGEQAVSVSGWTVFEVLDLLLVVLALMTLEATAARFGLAPDGPARLLPVAGGLALLIVGSQLVNFPPELAVLGDDAQTSVATGGWLALAGAALMFAGGVFSLARVSVTLSFEEREREVQIRREERAAATPRPEPPESKTQPLEKKD